MSLFSSTYPAMITLPQFVCRILAIGSLYAMPAVAETVTAAFSSATTVPVYFDAKQSKASAA